MKLEKASKKELGFIVCGMLIMCTLMNAVFLIIGAWDYRVLTSTALIGGVMILHFYLLCLTVQKAVVMEDKNDAKKLIKFSQSMRLLLIGAALITGVCLSNYGFAKENYVFNFWALIPPLLFNRITIMIRSFALKRHPEPVSEPIPDVEDEQAETEETVDEDN